MAEYKLTPTGRVTIVGTRKCSKCGRDEQTKKDGTFNARYTLCKGICVYCYNKPQAQGGYRKATTEGNATQLSEAEIRARIAYLNDLLSNKAE